MSTMWKVLVVAGWAAIVVLFVMVFRLNKNGSDLTEWAGDVTQSPVMMGDAKFDRPSWSLSQWADSLWVVVTEYKYRIGALDHALTDDFFPPPPAPPDW